MRSSILEKYQERYVRRREGPYFGGMGREDAHLFGRNRPKSDFQENVSDWNSSLYSSDIGAQNQEPEQPFLHFVEAEEMMLKGENPNHETELTLNFDLETYISSLSRANSTIVGSSLTKEAPVLQTVPNPRHLSNLGNSLVEGAWSSHTLDTSNDLVNGAISRVNEANGWGYNMTKSSSHSTEISRQYSMNKKTSDLSTISLPQSAASFYSSHLPQMEVVMVCESINKLNQYLQARKSDLRAGVPGRFLHAVIGQEVADVGSIVSTMTYGFYLSETLNNSHLCTIPIINMKRKDLHLHPELKWLFDSCGIDSLSLIFIDEVDLSYYDLYGCLKLVLINSHKLPAKQEVLKEALIEIVNSNQVGSCCTLVAEKFAETSPDILAGRGFSRLLLAGILLDTGNLTNAQCTSKDKYMSTLLINGAGRFGCNGLFTILKYKMFDISELKVRDILHKDFKRLTRVAGKLASAGSRLDMSQIGMSSIGISIGELLLREDSATTEIIHFQKLEKLRLLVVVSGYYDNQKIFKREIILAADTMELMRTVLHFFDSNAFQLPLKAMYWPGFKDVIRAFEIDNKITSRKTIERLLEEFCLTARHEY